MSKQYVNASIHAVGFDTPGAASSAADFEGVWGEFWASQSLKFRIFVDDFSMSNSKLVSECAKSASKTGWPSLAPAVSGPKVPLGGRGE